MIAYTEGDIYREAFELVCDLRSAVEDAVSSGWINELPEISPPELGGEAQTVDFMAPALALLGHAREHGLALWGDDAFIRLLHHPHGLLLPEVIDAQSVDFLRNVQQSFKQVTTIGTEDILRWLELQDVISHQQRVDYLWQLHQNGYRFLDTSDVFPVLLQRFHYNLLAQPIVEWLKGLETGYRLTPSGVNPEHFENRFSFYAASIFAKAIVATCYLEDAQLTLDARQVIIDDLASRCQAMLPDQWSNAHRWFWHTLISQGFLKKIESIQRYQKLIENFLNVFKHILSSYPTHRRHVIREIETTVIGALPLIGSRKITIQDSANKLISILLRAFFSGEYIQDFDPVFWRLMGYAFGKEFEDKIRVTKSSLTGESIEWEVDNIEIEREACQLLAQWLAGEKPTMLKYLTTTHIGFLSQSYPDYIRMQFPKDDSAGFPCEHPLIPLPLFAEPSLRQALLETFQKRFKEVEPPLGEILNELQPKFSSDD